MMENVAIFGPQQDIDIFVQGTTGTIKEPLEPLATNHQVLCTAFSAASGTESCETELQHRVTVVAIEKLSNRE